MSKLVVCSLAMWYHSPLRAIPLHKATQKGDSVEVAALLAQVCRLAMHVLFLACCCAKVIVESEHTLTSIPILGFSPHALLVYLNLTA